MSKSALKKELQMLTKEQLIEQVLDLYEKNKSVKTFYNLYLNPKNEKALLEKCRKEIYREFNVERPERARLKFSVAKQAIAELKDVQASPEIIADAMLYLAECACEFTYQNGDVSGAFYSGAYNNFSAALKFIAKQNLLSVFRQRAEQCVKWASPCGYGFADDIRYEFLDHYQEN
ncbi:MAG: hypothetical protein JST52_02255 [Bacteroidetes bacterium]|nr:hypothetical protein [Bacteroidota bacterium]MBS1740673.1 hypothetical protein [Bacteroidota bacterium]MBS1775803.1 hypothetical protein [Bacteroidota bacterium]